MSSLLFSLFLVFMIVVVFPAKLFILFYLHFTLFSLLSSCLSLIIFLGYDRRSASYLLAFKDVSASSTVRLFRIDGDDNLVIVKGDDFFFHIIRTAEKEFGVSGKDG